MSSEISDRYRPWQYTNETTQGAAISGSSQPHADSTFFWAQIEDDGVNLHFRLSHDGIYFFEVISDGRTDWMASPPDKIGFALGLASDRTGNTLHLRSWKEE